MNFVIKEFGRMHVGYIGLIKEWWDQKKVKIEDNTMSDFGYMISNEEDCLAAIFLYPINGSNIALVGFPIANPKADKDLRREAILELMGYVEARARNLDYSHLLSYAGSPGAKEMFNRLGYLIGDKDVVSFVKKI